MGILATSMANTAPIIDVFAETPTFPMICIHIIADSTERIVPITIVIGSEKRIFSNVD